MLVRVWGKRNTHTLLVGCKLVQPVWKTVWRLLKKLKIKLSYNPAIPLLGTHLKACKQVTIKTPAHPCLLLLFSQYPSYGKSQDTPQLMNRLRKHGIYIQWNFIQS
jgi:hypothetical protein